MDKETTVGAGVGVGGEIGCLIFPILIGGALLWFWGQPDGFSARVRYSWQYDVPQANVQWISDPNAPTECDWDRAPLGGKGCHYMRGLHFDYGRGDVRLEPIDERQPYHVGEPIRPTLRHVYISWTKVTENRGGLVMTDDQINSFPDAGNSK